ncbi:hypothetical protein KP509_15G066400 [Ceratopteris richardii]|nr:hypothetical protein KP509_15G066400 [Ceratopteris richardii]
MFVDCGSMSSALRIFHKAIYKSEYSWTALLFGFAKSGSNDHVFDLHTAMKDNNVPPSIHTILALLRACIQLLDVQKGQEVHLTAVIWGLDHDMTVSSSIIDMYAKCGLIQEASYTLSIAPTRNVITWTALISGYADHGLSQEAVLEFTKMQSDGVPPNAVTIACLLKALNDVSAADAVGKLIEKIEGSAFESDPLVGNSLVGMHARFGSIQKAKSIFDQLSSRDVVSWNALISGLLESGAATDAIAQFKEMSKEKVSPDSVTFTCICKACGSLGDVENALCVHLEITKLGLGDDYFVGNSLSYMYANCDLLSEAIEVFKKLAVKDVVSWSTLIAAFAKHGPGSEGLNYFNQMKSEGILPNAFTFCSVLRACISVQALDTGRDIHMEIEQKGFGDIIPICSALVALYSKCGSLIESQYVFDQLHDPDILSWNALVSGYAEHGPCQQALKCFNEMQDKGVQPDIVSFAGVLKALGGLGALESGRGLHSKLSKHSLAVDPCIGNGLINMYARCGSLLEAEDVFNRLPIRDVVVWSSMIQAFGMNHEGGKAVGCFEEMQRQGVKPNCVTFTCLLSACSHSSLAVEGKRYFKAMRQDFGIIPLIEHYNCIIDLLARSGHLFEAERVCELIGLSSEGALSSLLTASCICGETELALRCFQNSVKNNMHDAGLYVLMVDTFTSAGRLTDALQIEDVRRYIGAFKKPAEAFIEIDNEVYGFIVGDKQTKDVKETLRSLRSGMKSKGNMTHLGSALTSSPYEKEASACEHAEKIALAFGLLHTPEGQTLRVTKNLRMCHDCHITSMFISKEKKREIIIQDKCCIHHFKDGLCSCGDMF